MPQACNCTSARFSRRWKRAAKLEYGTTKANMALIDENAALKEALRAMADQKLIEGNDPDAVNWFILRARRALGREEP